MKNNKHKNYEILNLIGYGLAKFDNSFIEEFGFSSKSSFYKFCVQNNLAEQTGVIKNRMDLFDPFFPNKRKGWWQKGDAYIHRKILIDNLFGNENVTEYANIIKLYMKNNFSIQFSSSKIKPIIKSRFKKLQETGLEAELYFMKNFQNIKIFKDSSFEDARLYGDGYDFQINTYKDYYLTEVKGIRETKGYFRLTENEYQKAIEYKEKYIITVVANLNKIPNFITIEDPIKNLNFTKKIIKSANRNEYHLKEAIC